MPGPKEKAAFGARRRIRASVLTGSAYRCKRRFGLAFGHAIIFCEVVTAVPWRMVPTASGCKDAFDQLLFLRLPLRQALPASSRERERQRGEGQGVSLYLPGLEVSPRAARFRL